MLLLLIFSLAGATSAAYDDSLARNKLMPMSAAAYSSYPSTCLMNTFPNATLKRQLEVYCDITLVDKCSGFTAVSHSDKAIIVSYRGTNQNFELVAEGEETLFKNHTPWVAGGKVSKYFYDGFTRLWNQGMKNDFSSLANSYPSYQIWVTGHSLGGAMAILSASYIVHNQLVSADKVTLVTFGEPRVGDGDFAAACDKELKAAYRVVHDRDIVPHVPLKNEEGYRQHKTEIYYKNEDMGPGAPYKVCLGDESMLCSDGNIIDPSMKDHLHYFNTDVYNFGVKGCYK